MFRLDLEFGGLLDNEGNIGRPVGTTNQILVPEEIWLEGDAVRWRKGDAPRLEDVSRSILDHFVGLSDETSILRFARRWGVLALGGELGLPARNTVREGIEPVAAWQYYSRRARAVL